MKIIIINLVLFQIWKKCIKTVSFKHIRTRFLRKWWVYFRIRISL